MKDPILITGCARSGTSMSAGIVNICGAFGGGMTGPTRNNKKGMIENSRIRNEVIKIYLRKINCDPLGQFPLPNIDYLLDDSEWLKVKVLQIMKDQGLLSNMDWFYKGAKMCLIWPLWYKAFPGAKWIIIRRDREEIVQSCMKTSFMRAFDEPEGWRWWVHEHLLRFGEMWHCGLNIREIWPRKIIEGNLSELKDVINWLGLPWREKEILDFISPALWHSKS